MRKLIALLAALSVAAAALGQIPGSATGSGGPTSGASLAPQNPGTVLSGPCSGSAAAPTASSSPCVTGTLTAQQFITASNLVCDGVTDNTTALAADIAAYETSSAQGSGIRLVIPQGSCLTGPQTITGQIAIDGQTNYGTRLLLKSGSNAALFTVATTGSNFPSSGYPNGGVEFTNLRFDSQDGKTFNSTEPLADAIYLDQHTGASFTASISGTTLTVTGVTGTIISGMAVVGFGVPAGERITAGSGTTWTVSISATVSSEAMTGGAAWGYWARIYKVVVYNTPGDGVRGIGGNGFADIDQYYAQQVGGNGIDTNSTNDWVVTHANLSLSGIDNWLSSGDTQMYCNNLNTYSSAGGHGLHIFGTTTFTCDGHNEANLNYKSGVYLDTLASNAIVNLTGFVFSQNSQYSASNYPDLYAYGGAGNVYLDTTWFASPYVLNNANSELGNIYIGNSATTIFHCTQCQFQAGGLNSLNVTNALGQVTITGNSTNYQWGVPVLLPGASSMTIGTTGAFTLTTALPNVAVCSNGCWMYFSANAFTASSAAGPYWVVCSSTTACQAYNNLLTTGVPYIVPTTTSWGAIAGSTYSSPTSAVNVITLPMGAGFLGANGNMETKCRAVRINNSDNEQVNETLGGTGIGVLAGSSINWIPMWRTLQSLGSQSSQVSVAGNGTVLASDYANGTYTTLYSSVNTATPQNLVFSLSSLTAASDWVALLGCSIQVNYAP